MDEPSESRPRARSELFNDPEHARLPREDPDVADAVRAAFAEDGIDVVLGAAVDASTVARGTELELGCSRRMVNERSMVATCSSAARSSSEARLAQFHSNSRKR
jgi:hypothetical protein